VPEILEVESYRRLADRVVGSTIVRGWSDAYSAKKLTSPSAWARAVKGLTVTGTSRRGKLLLLETSGVRLGIRFGMTGVLLIDDVASSSTTGESSSCTTRVDSAGSRSTPTSANSGPTLCR
jgi:formamidopyrimidine-DNA glycosylase